MVYVALAIGLVLLVVVLAGAVLTRHLGRTPFQRAQALAEATNRSRGGARPYDVFVSYRAAADTIVARQLAERLIAEGLVPWFAEYVIPIRRPVDLTKALELGVRSAQSGLCLTSPRYYESQWCRFEFRQLSRSENLSSRSLVALKLAESAHHLHDEAPWRAQVAFESFPQAVERVCAILGVQIRREPEPEFSGDAERRTFQTGYGDYSLDVTGWEVSSRPRDAGDGDKYGPTFKRWIGTFCLWGHVVVGPQDRETRRLMTSGDFDNREYFEEALRFADEFFRLALPQSCVGVHLLFLDGWSHVALTTFFKATWSRVYSVVFPDPKGGADIEYSFFFFARERFRDFCRHAHVMDDLVLSLQISSP